MALKKNTKPAAKAPSATKPVHTFKSKPAQAAQSKPAREKTPPPKFLVKLIGGAQCQDPGTKVMLLQGQLIPVPEISNWVRFQATVGYLEIIEM